MEIVTPLMVVSALAVSFGAYKIYPGSGEPVVVIVMVSWVTPIVIIIPFGIIIMVWVSLTIYIWTWVIIGSITWVTVIIPIDILVHGTVTIIITTIVGIIIIIWMVSVPLVSIAILIIIVVRVWITSEFWPIIPPSALPIVFLILVVFQ